MASEEVEVFRGAAVFGRRELIESILREERIPYVIRSEGGIAEHPITVGPMGEFIVLVPEEHAERAAPLLQQVQEAEPPETDADEAEEDPLRTTLGLRTPTERDKRITLVLAIVCAMGALALLAQFPDGEIVFGILLLLMAGLLIAYSRHP